MHIQENSVDHEKVISPEDDISHFIETLEAQIAELKAFASSNPHITRADLLPPTTDTIAKEFRAKILEIFNKSGVFIGRNSPEAIKGDLIKTLEVLNKNNYHWGTRWTSPQDIVQNHLSKLVDTDMQDYLFEMHIYRDSIPKLYATIKDWRTRNRVGIEKFSTRPWEKR